MVRRFQTTFSFSVGLHFEVGKVGSIWSGMVRGGHPVVTGTLGTLTKKLESPASSHPSAMAAALSLPSGAPQLAALGEGGSRRALAHRRAVSWQTPHRRRDVRPARRCAPRRRTRWRKTLTMGFFCESGPTRAEGEARAVDADSVHTCTLSLSHQQSVRPPKPQPLDAPGDVAMKWPDFMWLL